MAARRNTCTHATRFRRFRKRRKKGIKKRKSRDTVSRGKLHKLGSGGFAGWITGGPITREASRSVSATAESSCHRFINSFACLYSFERLNRKRRLHDKAGDVRHRLRFEIHVCPGSIRITSPNWKLYFALPPLRKHRRSSCLGSRRVDDPRDFHKGYVQDDTRKANNLASCRRRPCWNLAEYRDDPATWKVGFLEQCSVTTMQRISRWFQRTGQRNDFAKASANCRDGTGTIGNVIIANVGCYVSCWK